MKFVTSHALEARQLIIKQYVSHCANIIPEITMRERKTERRREKRQSYIARSTIVSSAIFLFALKAWRFC